MNTHKYDSDQFLSYLNNNIANNNEISYYDFLFNNYIREESHYLKTNTIQYVDNTNKIKLFNSNNLNNLIQLINNINNKINNNIDNNIDNNVIKLEWCWHTIDIFIKKTNNHKQYEIYDYLYDKEKLNDSFTRYHINKNTNIIDIDKTIRSYLNKNIDTINIIDINKETFYNEYMIVINNDRKYNKDISEIIDNLYI